jgi:hypothetical protein
VQLMAGRFQGSQLITALVGCPAGLKNWLDD